MNTRRFFDIVGQRKEQCAPPPQTWNCSHELLGAPPGSGWLHLEGRHWIEPPSGETWGDWGAFAVWTPHWAHGTGSHCRASHCFYGSRRSYETRNRSTFSKLLQIKAASVHTLMYCYSSYHASSRKGKELRPFTTSPEFQVSNTLFAEQNS